MKGDITRSTFNPTKHFDRVLQQQGRVTVDADFNELADIFTHRLQSTAADVIGASGAPIGNAGFALGILAGGDFSIGAGCYYVDGILVENESATQYTTQPYLPGVAPLNEDGKYLVYLEVWKRHITALEDDLIRETALGGPDTATRSKVIWQVKLLKLAGADESATCDTNVPSYNSAIAPSTGTLAARLKPGDAADSVCVLPPKAGYRRLENQLYRVEIHDASDPATVTFKWSRENGSIAAKGEFIDGANDRLKLVQSGGDAVRGFATGDWIELTTEGWELNFKFKPGILVRLKKLDGGEALLDLTTATAPIKVVDFPDGPKIRRWDSKDGLVSMAPAGSDENGIKLLEDGVQVKFSPGSFHNGDYWQIPARTAPNQLQWPTDPGTLEPLSLLPFGIRHHYARLGIIKFDGGTVTSIQDCRALFPPVTKLTSFFYVSGDGQEAAPDPSKLGDLLPLPQDLQVGVANGAFPVQGAQVKFRVTRGGGNLPGNLPIVVATTDASGVARVQWSIDSSTVSQEVEARLIDGTDTGLYLPVRFHATLSTADRVSYNPAACPDLALAGAVTVQKAIDNLCKMGGHGCCTTVGEGGEFPTLEAALEKLLGGGQTQICLCLLPGRHRIDKQLAAKPMKPGTVVHIKGCGAATHVEGKKGAGILFGGSEDATLEEVVLENFDLVLGQASLEFAGVGRMRMSHLNVQGIHEEGVPLVKVSRVVDARLNHNHIDAHDSKGAALAIVDVSPPPRDGESPLVDKEESSVLELSQNRVDGITTFYGIAPKFVKPGEFDAAVAAKDNFKAVVWLPRDAVITGNEFDLVTVDGEFWKKLFDPQALKSESIFRQFAFTNNRLRGGPQIFVAGFMTFTGNYFDVNPDFYGGALGFSAAFVSNQELNPPTGDNLGPNPFLSGALHNQGVGYLLQANQMRIAPKN